MSSFVEQWHFGDIFKENVGIGEYNTEVKIW